MSSILSADTTGADDKLARLAGLLYALTLPTTGLWYGTGRSLTAGDASTVLANLEASRALFELSIVAGAVGAVIHLVLVLMLYRLFRPVGERAATLMLAFLAASVPLSLAAVARQIDILALLDGTRGLSTLGSEQIQTQVMLAIRGYDSLFLTSAIFWGLWLLPLGWLILRCGFIPRVLGFLVLLGAPFYLLAFAGPVFDPAYQESLLASIVGIASGIPDLVGEVGTALWLLIMGKRMGSSRARAAAI